MAKDATLKERMKKRLEDQKSRRSSGAIKFIKDGETLRMRILFMGEEEEFIQEITQFYLGSEIKGVISPVTLGEPCAIHETWEEFKNSDDDDEKELANKFAPRKRYLAFAAIYKDTNGSELDEENSPKFVLLTAGVYQEVLELYLDEGEWGDMTDPINGYDIKISRSGSGKLDTEYSVKPCKNTKGPKEFRGTYSMDEEIRKIIPSYDQTKEYLETYIGGGVTDDDDEPKKKKKKIKKAKKDLD